jgi:DNA-directed RNA polymerase subunit RPC12/RpoP
MARELHTLRGELHCFACGRYLGDFESHPELHGKADVHVLPPLVGELPQHAIETGHGLRCSRCGGRVVLDYVERATVALAA